MHNYRRVTTALFVLVSLLTTTGCTAKNYYSSFYQKYNVDVATLKPATKNIRLVEIDDFSEVYDWQANGYEVIGSSSFSGKWLPRAYAIDCAKAKGSTIILVKSTLNGTKSISQTINIPTQQTTYHHGTVYGAYGSVNYYGTSTTNSLTPINLNYQIQDWSQTAIFLAKLKEIPEFGVKLSSPPNTPGATKDPIKVLVVYRDSKAEKTGIKLGDTVTSINGVAITNDTNLTKYINGSEKIFDLGTKSYE